MERTGRPVAAGILDIISGGLSFLAAVVWGVSAAMANSGSVEQLVFVILLWASIIAGPLAIAVGILTLMRRFWWIALFGSIAALLPICLGLISIIFVVQSKEEFT